MPVSGKCVLKETVFGVVALVADAENIIFDLHEFVKMTVAKVKT